MARPNISLTEMEESVIKTIEDSDADLDIYALSDLIKISTKQLRGVVSSLVKKGVVEWYGNDPQNIDCYNPDIPKLQKRTLSPFLMPPMAVASPQVRQSEKEQLYPCKSSDGWSRKPQPKKDGTTAKLKRMQGQ